MPKIRTSMSWKEYKDRWSNCQDCKLGETRNKIVLATGCLPCDVLFIGEAPGASEDTLGIPFIGPAGTMLRQQISDAEKLCKLPAPLKIAYTNLVGCIPIGDDGRKANEPDSDCIKACYNRLNEFVTLVAKPKAIVAVGSLPRKWLPKFSVKLTPNASITHPAAILRMMVVQRGLEIQNVIVTLADLFEELK